MPNYHTTPAKEVGASRPDFRVQLVMVMARWTGVALVCMSQAAASTLPFLYSGTSLNITAVQVVVLDESVARINCTVYATNEDEPIEPIEQGYSTTLRVTVGSLDTYHESAYRFCDLVKEGCPIETHQSFSFNFSLETGGRLKHATVEELKFDILNPVRDYGSTEVHLIPEYGTIAAGIGIIAPVGFLVVSLIKYCLVVWLDPEPVSAWNPLEISASGANELAELGSFTQVFRYLQFIACTAFIDLQYPEYYPSLIGPLCWVYGMFSNNWYSGAQVDTFGKDGLAILAGESMLEATIHALGIPSIADLWPAAITYVLIFLIVAAIVAIALKWKREHRYWYSAAYALDIWDSVLCPATLFIILTSLLYIGKANVTSSSFYVPLKDSSYALSNAFPYSFALGKTFYDTPVNGGVIFSMALVLFLWVALTAFITVHMIQARRRGYLTVKNLIIWGKLHHGSKNDIFYHIFHVCRTIVTAFLFSFLSKQSLAQVIILLVIHLLDIATASGTRPNELSFVGFTLLLIPKLLQVVTCCMMFALIPQVVQAYPDLTLNGTVHRITHAIIAVHFAALFYYLLLDIVCICITTWRHFKFDKTPLVPHNSDVTLLNSSYTFIPTDVYYRPPRNQPDRLDDSALIDNDSINTNYATREVDYVYGINGYASQPNREIEPRDSERVPIMPVKTTPRKFKDKMFGPLNTGIESLKHRGSMSSYAPFLPERIRRSLEGARLGRNKEAPKPTFEVLRQRPPSEMVQTEDDFDLSVDHSYRGYQI